MRILLIFPAYYDNHNSWTHPTWRISRIPPISLLSLSSYLNAKGHEAKIVDCRELIYKNKTNDITPLLIDIIDEFKPDVIGFNFLTALFDQVKELSRDIRKKFPNTPIIAGGAHPSIEPKRTFAQIDDIDAICIGPGEEVCLDIAEGADWTNIKGLMTRAAPEKYKRRDSFEQLDDFPFLDYDSIDHEYYTVHSAYTIPSFIAKSLTIITSRSCPYTCKFCASEWSRPFRQNSTEYIIENVKYLSRFDINTIAFHDDTFAANKKRLAEVCEEFIRHKLFYPHTNLRWYAAIRANQVTPELLSLMKRSGCFFLAMGIESGNNRVLEHMNKKSTVEMNRQALAHIREAGMLVACSHIIGAPTETIEEIADTLAWLQEIDTNFRGCGSFRLLPGSPYYRELSDSGIIDKDKINWSKLGDFSSPPEQSFCEVDLELLKKLVTIGQKMAYKDQWIGVLDSVARNAPDGMLEEVDAMIGMRVVTLSNASNSPMLTATPYKSWVKENAGRSIAQRLFGRRVAV